VTINFLQTLSYNKLFFCDAFADLFLIRPPPDSVHQAVNPAHILISGDSAGGGLALALLQVIRDSGLPPPAGGILVSPWCDLSHSFPSIHVNTKTVCTMTHARFASLFSPCLGRHP
jgi:acetyl esterase/lipase